MMPRLLLISTRLALLCAILSVVLSAPMQIFRNSLKGSTIMAPPEPKGATEAKKVVADFFAAFDQKDTKTFSNMIHSSPHFKIDKVGEYTSKEDIEAIIRPMLAKFQTSRLEVLESAVLEDKEGLTHVNLLVLHWTDSPPANQWAVHMVLVKNKVQVLEAKHTGIFGTPAPQPPMVQQPSGHTSHWTQHNTYIQQNHHYHMQAPPPPPPQPVHQQHFNQHNNYIQETHHHQIPAAQPSQTQSLPAAQPPPVKSQPVKNRSLIRTLSRVLSSSKKSTPEKNAPTVATPSPKPADSQALTVPTPPAAAPVHPPAASTAREMVSVSQPPNQAQSPVLSQSREMVSSGPAYAHAPQTSHHTNPFNNFPPFESQSREMIPSGPAYPHEPQASHYNNPFNNFPPPGSQFPSQLSHYDNLQITPAGYTNGHRDAPVQSYQPEDRYDYPQWQYHQTETHDGGYDPYHQEEPSSGFNWDGLVESIFGHGSYPQSGNGGHHWN